MASRQVNIRFFPKPYNILLIEPPNNLFVGFNATVVVEPLGLQYIAGAISDIATVRIYDMRVDPKPLCTVMEEFQPDLVGIRENYTVDVPSVKEVAQQVKLLAPDVPVVVGGHHVSLVPEDAYSPWIDGIVVGDGEWTFRRLVENIQKHNRLDTTESVIFRDNSGLYSTANVPFRAKTSLKEFDSDTMNQRPQPARGLVDQYRPSYFFLYHERPYSIEMARGCIYRCNFCSVHEFHKGEYRVQGNERTLTELASLPKRSWVNVVDDLAIQEVPASLRLPHGYDPMDRLADEVAELNMGHRYWMQVRADNVVRNPRKFEKWAKAGLDTVLVGLESFDQADLNSVSKGSKLSDNEQAIEILHSFGIRIWGAVLVFQGWMDSNFDHLKKKVIDHRIEFPQFTILTPLPGTVQWRETKDRLISKEYHLFDFLHSVLPTQLGPRHFYEQYASLWRTVGGGGLDRARKMAQEASATRQSVMLGRRDLSRGH
ncbi:MAG: cobalamin B12-binding domain protein [Dehalococcoidia bacterium]|nr:cobalamin B12-binding domain protein [Dehalococcoidia bacterium]